MDDLAQFDRRRRPWRPQEPAPRGLVSVSFKPVPPVPLPEPDRSFEWMPRLGFR